MPCPALPRVSGYSDPSLQHQQASQAGYTAGAPGLKHYPATNRTPSVQTLQESARST